MKAYSVDLREKVLRAVDQGSPREEIIKLLGVSRATIKRYVKQRRETGRLRQRLFQDERRKSWGCCKRSWQRSCKPMMIYD